MLKLILTKKENIVPSSHHSLCCRFYVYTSSFDGDKYYFHSYSQLSHARLCIQNKVRRFALGFPCHSYPFTVIIEKKPHFDSEPCVIYYYKFIDI